MIDEEFVAMTATTELQLSAADGHTLAAFVATPAHAPLGGIVVLQEIFGVNAHILHDVELFAAAGFKTIAPAMFDRVQRGADIPYADVPRGLAIANAIGESQLLVDIQAAIAVVADAGPVTVIGFCWGGALAYLAAARCQGVSMAACYYGSRIAKYCETMTPAVPVIYHFGALDKSLPADAIAKIRAADPRGRFHVYDGADHAFTNSDRPSYDAAAAALAHERTIAFIRANSGTEVPHAVQRPAAN